MILAPTRAASPKISLAQSVCLGYVERSSVLRSTREVALRLAAYGANEIKEGRRISPVQIFLGSLGASSSGFPSQAEQLEN